MTLPAWLRSPDPNLDPDYLRRARYAYPAICRERLDRPIVLAGLHGPEVLDVDAALELFERMARERLP
jgi:hypothetical protein